MEPFQDTLGGNIDLMNPPLAGLKASTGILVKANDDGTVELLSTFDATTSKHSNFSMQEQNPFLGTLAYVLIMTSFIAIGSCCKRKTYSKRLTNVNNHGQPYPDLLVSVFVHGGMARKSIQSRPNPD